MTPPVTPFSLKDAPALIERLLPVQKLSAEAYKEQMAGSAKTLTALGSYWKGRKPLILNKACILGCLLPAMDDLKRDLEIFEKLMAMDDESFAVRWSRRPQPKEILATLSLARISDYFTVEPSGVLPESAPVDWTNPEYAAVQVEWRESLSQMERRRLEAQMLPKAPYRERVEAAKRTEEVMETVHDHIWDTVNAHLGTSAQSFPELVEQLGIMRFGHRPRVADTFCGSGQIPFEAARLGCDVYASDLNPVACMLAWGALHLVGAQTHHREAIQQKQRSLMIAVQSEIDNLGIEVREDSWRAKVFLYCAEVRCPQTGWMVPLLPSLVVSEGAGAIVELEADALQKRYNIQVRTGVLSDHLHAAKQGTVRSDGRGKDPYLVHTIEGVEYRTKISTLRGDYRKPDGSTGNRLRLWEKGDFKPRADDLFQERLYAIQWMRPKKKGKGFEYAFCSVTENDLRREQIVEQHVKKHLEAWQEKGWVPDMRIESGDETERLYRERGWTHWHHLFNPRQILLGALLKRHADATLLPAVMQALQNNARLSIWNSTAGHEAVVPVFYNQALNTVLNYGCRGSEYVRGLVEVEYKPRPIPKTSDAQIANIPAWDCQILCDVAVTDPPYGDAVKYEEILEFFIAWLRKNPPPEFAGWVWDSRALSPSRVRTKISAARWWPRTSA
jgi:putative DNA methylase